MRDKKYSRLKLYIITTFFAFVVSSAIISFFLVHYREGYLKNALSYINEKSPVNIFIKDISIDYPLRIVLNDFKIYSKTNTHGINNSAITTSEFLSIPSSSIFFNPFKILARRGIFYCISDVYISDAYLYPALIDNKLFTNTNNLSNDTVGIKNKIENILYMFEGKNIRVDNFNVDIADNNNEHTRISLQYMRADLKSSTYNFDTVLFLQEDTDVRFSISTKKDISYLESKLLINNKKHPILDCYVNSFIDTNNTINIGLMNGDSTNLGYINYDHNNNNIKFDITNIYIRRENIVSFYDAISSIPILQKIPLDFSISNVMEEFADIKLYANGDIKKNKILKLDMNVSSKSDSIKLDFNVKVTNNIAYSTNFYLLSKNIDLDARFSLPLNNPLLVNADIKIIGLNTNTNNLILDLSIKPVLSNNKKTASRLYINSLAYKEAINEPLLFDIEYLKNDNIISIETVTNNFIEPHITKIYLSKESPIKVTSYGIINKDILLPFVGQNTLGSLNSLIDINYKLYNTNNYLVNDLELHLKKIYTREDIAFVNLSFYSNKIILKKLDYNSIGLNFDASYNKEGEIKLEGDLLSPIGSQKIIASLNNTNSDKYLIAYTDDGMFMARGSITSNGNIKFNFETPTPLDFNNTIIDTKISLDNTTKTNKEYSIWGYLKAESKKYSAFNLETSFEVSNNSLLFTNVAYSYRDVSITGTAALGMENNITSIVASLKDIHSSGYLTASLTVNKDNVFGNVDVSDMSLAFGVGQSDIYGTVNTKITVMGIITDPIVHVSSFSIKNLEVPGYRFDVALSGSYKKEEVELTNVSIIKTGQAGFVVSQAANKIQHITIPRAYFSKDTQTASIDIANMTFLSSISAKIDYSMKKLLNGDYEYKVISGPIKINDRKLPAFSTIAIYDDNNLTMKSMNSHGINGNIKNTSTNILVDVRYLFDNKDFLNINGGIKKESTNQVDLMLSSSTLNLEIFEFFNNLFTTISSSSSSSKTNFVIGDKEYTLNARVYGNIDNLMVDGRLIGRANKLKLAYFSDTFTDTELDVSFQGHRILVNKLEFYTKNKKWLKLTGEAEFVGNTISFMDFDILSSDEQIGLLYADTDIGILTSKGPSHIDLNMVGSLANPRLNGTITLIKNDVELTMGAGEVYAERVYGAVSRQYFDLTIQALRGIRVVHNLVGDVSVENGSSMYVIGSKEQGINLQGTINLERGSIYYLQNIYTLERGYVTFPDVDSLDPIINATAYTYTKYIPPTITTTTSPNSDAYNVTLYMEMNNRISQILFNSASDNSPVRFYSIPTLGQAQVNQLASINTMSSSSDAFSRIYSESTMQANNEVAAAISGQQAIQAYGDLFLRNFALRPVERWARQFFGIDYISFSPTVINNLLFAQDGANNSFLSALDKTSVSIGKYTSKDLYLKYDVTYRFNDPERPVLLNKSENPYYFEHQFGFEVSLLRDFNLANFLFEYKINPFNIDIIKQEFNVLVRWRV